MTALSAPTESPPNLAGPTVDGCPVQLGDVVSYPEIGGCFSNGRVKGWSPCYQWLYVAWVGVIRAEHCHHCGDIAGSKFARIYQPQTENRWIDALEWGLAEQSGAPRAES